MKEIEQSERPWGHYVILADEHNHKVKRILVKPKKRLSLQSHQKRTEHWYLIEGRAVVTLDEQQIPLRAGESVDIPVHVKHRIENPTEQNVVFIEVQTGTYFGEDDIQRFEDDFGRV